MNALYVYLIMPRIVHLIAGYKGTGKDTFHKDLASGSIVFYKRSMPMFDYAWIPIWFMFICRIISLSLGIFVEYILTSLGHVQRHPPKWYVFSTRTSAIRACQEHLFVTRDRHQTAFARELKVLVHEKINRGINANPPLDDQWFETYKEQRIRIGNEMTTPRELYISVGEAAKRKDPIIWAKKCFDSFSDCDPTKSPEIIDITDWRFINEQIFANLHRDIYKIFTTRIYRSCIIPANVPSERGLDGIATDMILVPSRAEMIFALIRWPQYSRHMLIGELY
jgi:hypothetical protein